MFEKKEIKVEYKREYFKTLGVWWKLTNEGHCFGSTRVDVKDVPKEYTDYYL